MSRPYSERLSATDQQHHVVQSEREARCFSGPFVAHSQSVRQCNEANRCTPNTEAIYTDCFVVTARRMHSLADTVARQPS